MRAVCRFWVGRACVKGDARVLKVVGSYLQKALEVEASAIASARGGVSSGRKPKQFGVKQAPRQSQSASKKSRMQRKEKERLMRLTDCSSKCQTWPWIAMKHCGAKAALMLEAI